jgi:hypothetical protein
MRFKSARRLLQRRMLYKRVKINAESASSSVCIFCSLGYYTDQSRFFAVSRGPRWREIRRLGWAEACSSQGIGSPGIRGVNQ